MQEAVSIISHMNNVLVLRTDGTILVLAWSNYNQEYSVVQVIRPGTY